MICSVDKNHDYPTKKNLGQKSTLLPLAPNWSLTDQCFQHEKGVSRKTPIYFIVNAALGIVCMTILVSDVTVDVVSHIIVNAEVNVVDEIIVNA